MASQGGAMNVLRALMELRRENPRQKEKQERSEEHPWFACHIGAADFAVIYVQAPDKEGAEEEFRRQHPRLKAHSVTIEAAPGYRPPRGNR